MTKRPGSRDSLGTRLFENSKPIDAGFPTRQDKTRTFSGEIWRAVASNEEKERARRFREMFADLSPDVHEAYRKLAASNSVESSVITDAEIDAKLGPILAEFGFDLADLDIRRKQVPRSQEYFRRSTSRNLMVLDLDFTQQCELQEFRRTLETVVFGRRLNERWSAYCIPILSKEHSVGSACIADFADWKKMVAGKEQERLVDHMRRAHKGLVDAAAIEADFAHCRVVYFKGGEDESANRWAQIVNEKSQLVPLGCDNVSQGGDDTLILVDGETVIATLPHDSGNRVLGATVAVEEIESEGESQFLPNANAFIAFANRERGCRHYAS